MSLASELKRGLPAAMMIALAALIASATQATAKPRSAFAGSSLENERPQRVPARFASHHEEEEEEESEEEDIEWEMAHLEVERLALETFFGGLELIGKISEMVSDDDSASVLAVTTVTDEFDLPDSKLREFLREVANKAPSKAARRIARMKLAELHAEEGELDAALSEMRKLIFPSGR